MPEVNIDLASNPKFVNFITNAFEVPSFFTANMIDIFDSVAERNQIMLLSCYVSYKIDEEELSFEDAEKLLHGLVRREARIDDMDRFLAHAVLRTFADGCEEV